MLLGTLTLGLSSGSKARQALSLLAGCSWINVRMCLSLGYLFAGSLKWEKQTYVLIGNIHNAKRAKRRDAWYSLRRETGSWEGQLREESGLRGRFPKCRDSAHC